MFKRRNSSEKDTQGIIRNKPIVNFTSNGSGTRCGPTSSCARSTDHYHSVGLLSGRCDADVLGDFKMGIGRQPRDEVSTERGNINNSSVLDSVACGYSESSGATVSTATFAEWESVTLQIVPNSNVDNDKIQILLRAISELYIPRLKRLQKVNSTYIYEEECAFWEIVYSYKSIKFQLTVSRKWLEHFKDKIIATWPNANIKEIEKSNYDFEDFEIIKFKLKQHYFMSLNASKKEPSILNPLLQVVHDLKAEDEKVIIQIGMLPQNDSWRMDAIHAKGNFLKGNIPHRLEINSQNALFYLGKSIDGIMSIAKETFADLIGAKPDQQNKQERMLIAASYDRDNQEIIYNGGLSQYTINKPMEKGYDVTIKVAVKSKDRFTKNLIIKSISSSMQCLNKDNELVYDHPKNQVKELEDFFTYKHQIYKINKDILSLSEVARLIQLPQKTLQLQYPEIEQIYHRKNILPEELYLTEGYPLGVIEENGKSKTIHVQTKDYNILCLPHIVLGAMGTGKTNGQGVNTALGFLQNGFSAAALDVADGKLIDSIRDSLPEDFPEDHIIDLDFGNTDWPIALNWSEIAGSINNKGQNMNSRKAANRLSAQLVDFISRLSSNDTTDRMQRYLSAAGKAELDNVQASLLEPILLLSSKAYREKRLEIIKNPRIYDTIKSLHDLSDGARNQIIQPILDRLEMLLSNEFMANCILQRQKLDPKGNPLINFRKWLDGDEKGPYFIGLRVPKETLLDIATDRIVTFLVSKIWLSILSRYDTEEKDRKPCCFIMDEPHQFMTSLSLWDDMVREARKWRLKLVWLAHNFRDFKGVSKTFKDAGVQYSVYHSSKETYQDLLEELAPFELEELLNIPDRFYAVNKISVPGCNKTTPAFLAKMIAPPKPLKNRVSLRLKCSKKYGENIEVVEQNIYNREKVIYT